MKALLYKEFKLAMHPICYVFIFVFPLMILIPSYPLAVGFIYVLSAYPILFLGANKGQQSNDLLYSTLLPVRKKDIVLARIFTVFAMQFAFIAILSMLYPAALAINDLAFQASPQESFPGLDLHGFVSVVAFGIIGYSIADLIFFPIYYKKGKSIVMSTLFTIIGFVLFLVIFTIVFPFVIPGYMSVFNGEIWYQLIFLATSLAIYVGAHVIVYKISARRLEKVDF